MTGTADTPPGDGGAPAASTSTRGASVHLDGVDVTYPQEDGGTVAAVSAATLTIEAGSITALLGPSGCGKTSLLRAIAGLERPTAGTITIGERTVSAATPRPAWVHPERRHVGMVFQDGALFPHLTVAENIGFGLQHGGRGRTREARADRVAQMLALVDLEDFAGRLPGTLSGGQQQRVALARSLAPQPSVLLLDEPFSALDAALRIQVRAEVARIVRDVGVTTIFVTHDQDEAFVLGDRVAVLRNGRIEQVGTPDDVYRHPDNPWIAGFVGEANFVRGTVDRPAALAESTLGRVPLASPDRLDGTDAALVELLIRPEQLRISAPLTAGEPGDGSITGVEYYGHDVRYEVALGDGSSVAVRTQSPDLFAVGDRVHVGFDGQPVEAWPVLDPA